MHDLARFLIVALAIIFFRAAYADPLAGNVIFSNKSPFDITITPRSSTDCILNPDTTPFTVAAKTNHTYDIKIKSGCTDASIDWDYSQTYNVTTTIKGKVTYEQSQRNGKWTAKLDIRLTPPIHTPKPVIFRSSCGYKLLFCMTEPVALTANEIFSRFTVIPVSSSALYHRDFLPIGK